MFNNIELSGRCHFVWYCLVFQWPEPPSFQIPISWMLEKNSLDYNPSSSDFPANCTFKRGKWTQTGGISDLLQMQLRKNRLASFATMFGQTALIYRLLMQKSASARITTRPLTLLMWKTSPSSNCFSHRKKHSIGCDRHPHIEPLVKAALPATKGWGEHGTQQRNDSS